MRFGIGGSVLTAITTSNGATGSYNSMHDSYTPIGGGVPLANMLLGEIVFGGLGNRPVQHRSDRVGRTVRGRADDRSNA